MESKRETGSGCRESSSGKGESESTKGVVGLGDKLEHGGRKGSGKGLDSRSTGGLAERVEVRWNDDSVTEPMEAKGVTQSVASSRDSLYSRWLISAVDLLHTSQSGSGHSS